MKPSSRMILLVIIVAFCLLIIAGTFIAKNLPFTHAAPASASPFFSPYADVMDGPSLQSVAQSTGQKFYTISFVDSGGGTCNAEWDGTIPFDQTTTLLPHLNSDISFLRSQGGDVTVSFGGGGQELALTCQDSARLQAQYQRVIDTYHVTRLDFDIEEGAQGDTASYTRRNIALAGLEKANPGLTISFTLPALSTGLEDDSLGLLNNAKAEGVQFSIVNPMVFDFGEPDNNMGQAAIDGATAVFHQVKQIFPNLSDTQAWAMVGTTVMIGQSDSSGEDLTEQQAQQFVAFAHQMGMGSISFWELSRDNGSCPGQITSISSCSGLAQGNFAFTKMFER